jgi:hypothetical protein
MKKRNLRTIPNLLVATLVVGLLSLSPSASATADSGSISFNGNQFLSTTNMTAPGTGTFTYELWFNNTIETGTNQTIMNTRTNITAPQLRDGFDLAIAANRGLFASYRSLAFFNLPAGSIATNRWYHFAIVRQGNTVFSYLDGNLIASQALDPSDGLNFSSQSLWIGSTVGGANKFNGFISNFRYTRSNLYSANFTRPSDDYQAVANTSILLQTKNDSTFATNLIAGTTFTNNGGATSSSRNPFEPTPEEIAESNRRLREAERIAAIKAAREKIAISLETGVDVSPSQLIEADLPIRSIASLNSAYQELIAIRNSLPAPLSPQAVTDLKFNKFMKFAMIERMTGVNQGAVYARDLVRFGIISEDVPMKSLALHRLMKLPTVNRSTLSEVEAFFNAQGERAAKVKAWLAARFR